MPRTPRRPCRYPGCPKLAERGELYCAEHQPQAIQWHSQTYGSSWKRIRDLYIRSHPLCERCEKRGRYVKAQEVHHVKPVREGGTNEWDNLQALCHQCHMQVHGERNTRREE